MQTYIDRKLNSAPFMCPYHSSYEENHEAKKYPFPTFSSLPDASGGSNPLLICIVFICFFALSKLFSSFAKKMRQKNYNRWLGYLPEGEAEFLNDEKSRILRRQAELSRRTTSLFKSHSISVSERILLPLVVLFNTGLFASGHLTLVMSAIFYLDVNGENRSTNTFQEITVIGVIWNLWERNEFVGAFFLTAMSVIWPYIKQLALLALWFVPPSRFNATKRGRYLGWLDFFGKWAFLETFFLVIIYVIYTITISSPGSDLYLLRLIISPEWGLYSVLIAQIISLFSSHFVTACHRHVVQFFEKNYDNHLRSSRIIVTPSDPNFRSKRRLSNLLAAASDSKSSLGMNSVTNNISDSSITSIKMWSSIRQTWSVQLNANEGVSLKNYVFFLEGDMPRRRAKFRKATSIIIVLLSGVVVILVIAGCMLPLFSIKFSGLFGITINLNMSKNGLTLHYSLLEFAKALIDISDPLNTVHDVVGLSVVAVLIIIGTFILPLVHVLILLLMWFRPMPIEIKKRYFIALEVVNSLQIMDVFLLAIVLATSKVSGLAKSINKKCMESNFDAITVSLVQAGFLSSENAECLKISGEVDAGTICLLLATMGLLCLSHFVQLAASKALQDNEMRRQRNSAVDPDDPVVLIAPQPQDLLGPFRYFLVIIRDVNFDSNSPVLNSTKFAINESENSVHDDFISTCKSNCSDKVTVN